LLDERFVPSPILVWPNDLQGTAWIEKAGYHLFARQPGSFVAVGIPSIGSVHDVLVSGSFRKVGGPAGGGYGLIVGDQGPGPRDGGNQLGHYYVLGVGDRGDVGVWRRDGDHWTDLLPWTKSAAVRPADGRNDLTVRVAGQRLLLTVNGTEAADLVDGRLGPGTLGLFVGGDSNEVVVDHLRVEVGRTIS
jgi:hypothetical protein